MVYPALLPLMHTRRLPVIDWTDAPADFNGLVRFADRRNLVSARVPSHSAKTGHGPHSSKLVVICVVLLLFVLFYVLFVCKCVLYYCHRVLTQLQLTYIISKAVYSSEIRGGKVGISTMHVETCWQCQFQDITVRTTIRSWHWNKSQRVLFVAWRVSYCSPTTCQAHVGLLCIQWCTMSTYAQE